MLSKGGNYSVQCGLWWVMSYEWGPRAASSVRLCTAVVPKLFHATK